MPDEKELIMSYAIQAVNNLNHKRTDPEENEMITNSIRILFQKYLNGEEASDAINTIMKFLPAGLLKHMLGIISNKSTVVILETIQEFTGTPKQNEHHERLFMMKGVSYDQ